MEHRCSTSPTAVPGQTRPETRYTRRAAAATLHVHHLRWFCFESCFVGHTQAWAGSHSIRWGSRRGKWREWSWQRRRTAWTAPSGVQSWTQLSIYYIPWVATLSLMTQRRKRVISKDFMLLTFKSYSSWRGFKKNTALVPQQQVA